MIEDNEHRIIEELSKQGDITQRELSARTQLSLGAVNIILKRLVKRGTLKTRTLNPKKVEYLVTPKGFSEKAKKSYNYVLKTINLVKLVKEEIAKIVLEEFNKGQKKFVVLGDDDLADIIELALKGFNYKRVENTKQITDKDPLVLVGDNKLSVNGYRCVNMVERLGELYWGVDLQDYEK